MGADVGTSRAVEVLHDRGPARTPRWTVGSAYLLGGRYVLTAAHTVDYQQTVGAGEQLLVRHRWPSVAEYPARVVVAGTVEVDLALLQIDDPAFDGPAGWLEWAEVDRDNPRTIDDCWAVGFPAFKTREGSSRSGVRLRESEQVKDGINPGSNRVSGLLELQVTSRPAEQFPAGGLAGSPWEGMSGAVAFTADGAGSHVAIGVVIEHHRPEGVSSLTLAPVIELRTLLVPQQGRPAVDEARRLIGVDDPKWWLRLPQPAAAAGSAAAEVQARSIRCATQTRASSGCTRQSLRFSQR